MERVLSLGIWVLVYLMLAMLWIAAGIIYCLTLGNINAWVEFGKINTWVE